MGKYIVERSDFETLLRIWTGADGKLICGDVFLEPYNEPDIEAARKEAFLEGMKEGTKHCDDCKVADEAYLRRLKDPKEGKTAADCLSCRYERTDYRDEPCRSCISGRIIRFRPKERDEIRVGDEYSYDGVSNCIITEISDSYYRILWDDGMSGMVKDLNDMTRTGRCFPEIATILRKMKGER